MTDREKSILASMFSMFAFLQADIGKHGCVKNFYFDEIEGSPDIIVEFEDKTQLRYMSHEEMGLYVPERWKE